MEIFSNWIFWVVLASIVFVLALIGYLTESMKKAKKEDKKEEKPEVNEVEVNNVQPVQPEPVVTETNVPTDDWMAMPEVKVDTISEPAVDNGVSAVNNTEDLFSAPINNVTPEAIVSPVEVNPVNVEKPVDNVEVLTPQDQPVTPEVLNPQETATPEVTQTPVETLNVTSNDDKNNDIWNL